MSRLYFVSDWNGTLTRSSEEAANKNIGYTLLADAKETIDFIKFGKLVVAKLRTERALKRYKNGRASLWEVYEPFNSAIKGEDADYIDGIVYEFAAKTSGQVDQRILSMLRRMRYRNAGTGILSVAYDQGIVNTLEEVDYGDLFEEINIVGNRLQVDRNGKVIGLTLDIYGEKGEVFAREFIIERGFDANKTYYFGDTLDDEAVAELLPKGHFIIPLLVVDSLKSEDVEERKKAAAFVEHMASKHSAFVPESEEDLEKYLEAA